MFSCLVFLCSCFFVVVYSCFFIFVLLLSLAELLLLTGKGVTAGIRYLETSCVDPMEYVSLVEYLIIITREGDSDSISPLHCRISGHGKGFGSQPRGTTWSQNL